MAMSNASVFSDHEALAQVNELEARDLYVSSYMKLKNKDEEELINLTCTCAYQPELSARYFTWESGGDLFYLSQVHVHANQRNKNNKGVHGSYYYYFGRPRPPDQSRLQALRRLLRGIACLKEAGWGPPARKTKFTSAQIVPESIVICSRSFGYMPRYKRQISLNQVGVQYVWKSTCV